MNHRLVAAALGLALALVVAPARADDAAKKRLAVGDAVPAFAAKDVAGREVKSEALRAVTEESVAAAIRAAAGFEATTTWKADDPIDAIPGVKTEAGVDAKKRLAFVRGAGREFGLLTTPEASAKLKTMGDVAAWLSRAASAPIVYVFWFSRCPSAKAYADRLVALSVEQGARVYPIASNANESTDGIKAAEVEVGYRVLVDPEQRVCDLLGGRRTPHVFLVDTKGVLRYAGAIDDDFTEELPADARHRWLREAVESLLAGKPIAVPETEPTGCSIKRKPS